MLRNLTIASAILGIAAMFFLVARLKKPDPVAPPLVEPAAAPYEAAIGARGIIESLGENVHISPLISGVVEEVLVKVQDQVKKGDPLFRVDSRAARAVVASREAEIPVLTARFTEAEANLAEKKDLLDRVTKLGSKMWPARKKCAAPPSNTARPRPCRHALPLNFSWARCFLPRRRPIWT